MEYQIGSLKGPSKTGVENLLRRKVLTMENMKARNSAKTITGFAWIRRPWYQTGGQITERSCLRQVFKALRTI